MTKYEWKMRGLAKGIDPDAAVKELERIELQYGSLTTKNLLAAATPKDSLLHPLFLWDDSEAATRYRLSQANDIINNVLVNVISDGQPKKIGAYEIVTTSSGRIFKNVDAMSKEDVYQVRDRTLKELRILHEKLSVYSIFAASANKLEEAIDLLGDFK